MTTTICEAGNELAGQFVSVTGRLASMPRRQLVTLIEQRGGQYSPHVNRQSTIVVVGREGFPLRADGRPSHNLQRARDFKFRGQRLEILPEDQFLRELQLAQLADGICQTYSMAELTKLLGVPRSQIEVWQRIGFVTPASTANGLSTYDFRQVAAARSLVKLLNSGVKAQRLKRSLCELSAWYSAEAGTSGLIPPVLHESGRLAFRTDAGRLMEPTGQLLIEFEVDEDPPTVAWTAQTSGDGLFEEAVQLEQQGQNAEAACCYRRLLLEQGPDADVCFNLANTLVALGATAAAIERLYEAVMIDGEYVEAWNNLGNLLAEEDRLAEAADAYRRAVEIDPDYADSRYGLADILERQHRFAEAQSHWRAFLQQETSGEHADYARQRLAQLA